MLLLLSLLFFYYYNYYSDYDYDYDYDLLFNFIAILFLFFIIMMIKMITINYDHNGVWRRGVVWRRAGHTARRTERCARPGPARERAGEPTLAPAARPGPASRTQCRSNREFRRDSDNPASAWPCGGASGSARSRWRGKRWGDGVHAGPGAPGTAPGPALARPRPRARRAGALLPSRPHCAARWAGPGPGSPSKPLAIL